MLQTGVIRVLYAAMQFLKRSPFNLDFKSLIDVRYFAMHMYVYIDGHICLCSNKK